MATNPDHISPHFLHSKRLRIMSNWYSDAPLTLFVHKFCAPYGQKAFSGITSQPQYPFAAREPTPNAPITAEKPAFAPLIGVSHYHYLGHLPRFSNIIISSVSFALPFTPYFILFVFPSFYESTPTRLTSQSFNHTHHRDKMLRFSPISCSLRFFPTHTAHAQQKFFFHPRPPTTSP